MSEILQLNHQCENKYEFTLDVEGLASNIVTAWFVIKAKGVELTFPCLQAGNEFKCIIPPIPYIERGSYNACVRIVADSLYFEPVSDLLVNVVANLNIGKTDVKHSKITPEVKPRFEEAPKKDEKLKESATNRPTTSAIRKDKADISEGAKEKAARFILEQQKGSSASQKETTAKIVRKSKEVPSVAEKKAPVVKENVETQVPEKKVPETPKAPVVESAKDKAARIILEQQKEEMAKRKTVERKPVITKKPVVENVKPVSRPLPAIDVAPVKTPVITEGLTDAEAEAKRQKEEKIRNILGGFSQSKQPITETKSRFTKKS